jgi:hypothetical protein
LTGANRSSVRRNVIYNGHHYYAFEMSVYSDNAHVEDNYVYNNTVHTYGGPAVYLGGKGTNSLVRNNKFYNNIFWNINTIGEPGWWWGDGTHKIIFLGWYDGASSGADWGASLRELNASGLGGHDIKNNILRSNAGAGSGYILGYQSVGGAYVYDNSLANMQSSFPTAISGNIESDPLFAGTPPATNWWHLQSHSPAKDAGRVVNDPNAATGGWKPLTYNGSAPDIGAFEY